MKQRPSLTSRLYKAFLAPRQQLRDIRNRETVFNILVFGTVLIVVVITTLLFVSYFLLQNSYVLSRIVLSVGVLAFIIFVYWLGHYLKKYRVAALLLVLIYGFLAIACTWAWGINVPFAILLFALEIVLASILLGPKHALYSASIICLVLFAIQALVTSGNHTPTYSPTLQPSNFGDVISYSIQFFILALVSWLFGRQTELSLKQADTAEAALRHEKSLLKSRVEKRTMQLRTAQLEEIRNLYQFAEIGHLSTALLHDLANHLTSLTLDIEDLQDKQHSATLQRAQKSIYYLDDMVKQVRAQVSGKSTIQTFSATQKITETLDILRNKATQEGVNIEWSPPSSKLSITGDPIKFNQVIAVLLANAIEAYRDTSGAAKIVTLTARKEGKNLQIIIEDWGAGIPKNRRKDLFQPFASTKHSGLGIGLVIVKQIVDSHFKGSIILDEKSTHTRFVIDIPRE